MDPHMFVAAFKAASTPDARRRAVEKYILTSLLTAYDATEVEVLHNVRCHAEATVVDWVERVVQVVESLQNPVRGRSKDD
jgi:2-phospho-L-lactate guanylyltransferase (CobY/MobA/RfbA family)